MWFSSRHVAARRVREFREIYFDPSIGWHAFTNFDFDLLVRVAQIIATLIAAGVAVYVGRNWLKTLRNKTIDERLAAMYDVVDLIDRCFAIPVDQKDNRWRAYDAAWDSWRKANGMWAVVHGIIPVCRSTT
jgi:hypothetical protein